MNDVANVQTTDLVDPSLIGNVTGFEGLDNECFQTPFLKLAKDGTDEAKKMSPKYIPGLEPGMFFCPSSRRVFGPVFNAVVLRFYRAYHVYDGTGKESKFLGVVDADTYKRDIEPKATRVKSYTVTGDGKRYVDTRNFIVLSYDHLEDGPMLFSLYSTGITPSRKWVSAAMAVRARKDGKIVQAPWWSSVWKIKVNFYSDPKGDYYQVSSVERQGWVSKEHAEEIKALFDAAQSADVAAMASSAAAEEAPTHEEPAADKPTRTVQNVFGSKAAGASAAVEAEDDGIF